MWKVIVCYWPENPRQGLVVAESYSFDSRRQAAEALRWFTAARSISRVGTTYYVLIPAPKK